MNCNDIFLCECNFFDSKEGISTNYARLNSIVNGEKN